MGFRVCGVEIGCLGLQVLGSGFWEVDECSEKASWVCRAGTARLRCSVAVSGLCWQYRAV